MTTFIVQVRDMKLRMWGNQTEVTAETPEQAAEQSAGERLTGIAGARADLRARVWAVPFGSRPAIPFYVLAPASA